MVIGSIAAIAPGKPTNSIEFFCTLLTLTYFYMLTAYICNGL